MKNAAFILMLAFVAVHSASAQSGGVGLRYPYKKAAAVLGDYGKPIPVFRVDYRAVFGNSPLRIPAPVPLEAGAGWQAPCYKGKGHTAFFCRMEDKLESRHRIPFKFRLGSVEEVDRLEGK